MRGKAEGRQASDENAVAIQCLYDAGVNSCKNRRAMAFDRTRVTQAERLANAGVVAQPKRRSGGQVAQPRPMAREPVAQPLGKAWGITCHSFRREGSANRFHIALPAFFQSCEYQGRIRFQTARARCRQPRGGASA
ncbi:hypothetical protein SPHINGOAX6_70804 [Sphingomonas sp. AX6]|nr:hypothetical protein SPHINGOAX6_70804 [Sphingomonas sp. AX6]